MPRAKRKNQDGLPTTTLEAVRYFSNPDTCRDYFAKLRWPNGVRCPREDCGSENVHFIATRGIWRCNTCKRQFSAKVGTIFEDSPIGLDKWLPAIWVLTASKKGMSSYHLGRALGVTQKTAWFINHRIRLAMKTKEFNNPLSGEVEVDETFVGGKDKNKHESKRPHRGRGPIGKAAVMGLLERHGDLRAEVIPNTRRKALQDRVKQHVELGSAVYTDALRSYMGLDAAYIHEVIDHAESYAQGRVHTNGLENFWSLFKRGIYGTYHFVDPDHLDRYLDEFTHRFNRRRDSDSARFTATVSSVVGRRLTYGTLIGKTAP